MTSDEVLFNRLDSLRNNGRWYQHGREILGGMLHGSNYRITEFQSAILLAQLERLEDQTKRREQNAEYLSWKLGKIDGIKTMKRFPQISRQAYYYYVFRYDADAFNHVPLHVFRQALQAELGTQISSSYPPLNQDPLYQPHTKKRYFLSRQHLKMLDPKRFVLPVAERAYYDEAVLLHHPVLLAHKEDIDDIIEAVEKIQRQSAELYYYDKNKGTN